MANYSGKKPPAKPPGSDGEITVNDKKYRQVNITKLMLIASAYCDKYTISVVDHEPMVTLQEKMLGLSAIL